MTMKTTCKQTGFSLIEVLIVIVLLLIGILSVIRLFPPGFLVNRQTENTTIATRLAKQEVDRFTNSSANLMDAILPVFYNPVSGGFNVDLNATPDDLTDVNSNPASMWDYYWSNVNKIRRIMGEQVRIPLPSPTVMGRGSVYMLSSGPFMDVTWDGRNRSIFISGAPMIRRIVDAGATDPQGNIILPGNTLFSPAVYGMDYEDGKIGFQPMAYDRHFLVTFSYYDAGNNVQTIVDQTVDVPAGFNDWISLNSPGQMVDGSDICYRRFAELAPADPWSTFDPYQFKVYSPKVGPMANVGVLLFNPMGRDYLEPTAFGPQPLTARIDYDALDWRIIREDRPMPATPPYRVPLTLKRIKQIGDLNEDQTVYDGLFPTTQQSDQVDLLIYNISTGDRVMPTDSLGNPNFYVNYRDGTVTFSDAFGAANASATFRFFYRAHGDWALQIQKADTGYRRSYGPNMGFGEFFVGNGTVGRAGRLYFPLTEAGKTISIREIWARSTGANGLPNDQLVARNVSCRINNNPAMFENLNGNVLTWAEPSLPFAFDMSVGDSVRGVQGVSFKARVLWRNSATVSETAGGNLPRTRWRRIDLDTILTRSPN
jgi:prepilin-type N-terminal cleavage/methylation domain-containing protein